MGDLIETLSAISSSAISSSVVSSSNSAPEFQTHRYHDVRLSLHCDGMPRGKPSAFPSLTSQPKPKRFERLAKENERTAIGHEKPAKEYGNPASGSCSEFLTPIKGSTKIREVWEVWEARQRVWKASQRV